MIDLEKIREGDAHLDRAKELDPSIILRPVPMNEIAHTLTVKQAAELVQFHPETLRKEIREGNLKAVGGGKSSTYKISKVELEKWWRDKGGGDLFPKAEPDKGKIIEDPSESDLTDGEVYKLWLTEPADMTPYAQWDSGQKSFITMDSGPVPDTQIKTVNVERVQKVN
jgi:excisionase family DNA binding protein